MGLEDLLKEIECADAEKVEDIISAAFKRKRELYPQWDLIYLAMPKNKPEERKATLEYFWKLYKE